MQDRKVGDCVKRKYHNKKVIVNGIKFDSKKEAERYMELKRQEAAGEIQNLEIQKKFRLIPSQRLNGKCVERPTDYVADFCYQRGGEMVVEDVKSKATRTPQYIIKRKLMLYLMHIRVHEI